MRKLFERFMAKFDPPRNPINRFKAFDQSDIKIELIAVLRSTRTKRQLSAAREDGDFDHWDNLVVDLEEILRKNS